MSKRRSAAVIGVAVAAACSLPTVAPESFDAGPQKVDQRDPNCDVAQHFLDVSKAVGPGDAYPFPRFTVTCSDTTVTVTGNSVPHYKFVTSTENELTGTNLEVEFPRHPAIAEKVTPVAYATGPIGVTVGGSYLFSQTDGPPFQDILSDQKFTDACFGHAAPSGAYHHHGLNEKCLNSASLVSEPWTNSEIDPTTESPIVGYAADGFPIYGPRECADQGCSTVVKLQSSWKQVGDPNSYAWKAYEYEAHDTPEFLDQCNGHTGPKGDYHYHTTSNFPYTVGCLRGTPTHSINDSEVTDGGKPPPMGDGGMPPPPMGDGGMPPPPRDGGMPGPQGDGGMPPPPGDGGMPPPPGDGGMPPPRDGGMPPPMTDGGMLPPCRPGQTDHCCGDNVCDGPENAQNCSADCD